MCCVADPAPARHAAPVATVAAVGSARKCARGDSVRRVGVSLACDTWLHGVRGSHLRTAPGLGEGLRVVTKAAD
jgi:hypothetical protein